MKREVYIYSLAYFNIKFKLQTLLSHDAFDYFPIGSTLLRSKHLPYTPREFLNLFGGSLEVGSWDCLRTLTTMNYL